MLACKRSGSGLLMYAPWLRQLLIMLLLGLLSRKLTASYIITILKVRAVVSGRVGIQLDGRSDGLVIMMVLACAFGMVALNAGPME